MQVLISGDCRDGTRPTAQHPSAHPLTSTRTAHERSPRRATGFPVVNAIGRAATR